MTTVRIVDGLKYGFRFLGLYLGLLLVSGVFVVGGLAIAGDPVLSLRGGTLVLTPNLASASQVVLGGFAVVALGALFWLAFSFGLLYKLIADAVSTGVGLSTHTAGSAVADADDTGEEDADDTFAGGSDDETDVGQDTAREPPAAATSASEDDDVLSKMQASESSTTDADERGPGDARPEQDGTTAGAAGSGQSETQATDPLATGERADAEAESDTDPTFAGADPADGDVDESVPTESSAGLGDEMERDDETGVVDRDEPATEEPRPGQQRDFEREDAGQAVDDVEETSEATGGVDESDAVDAEEYDERGYPRRESVDASGGERTDEPTTEAAGDADPLNEPADPPEPSDEFVERTEDSTEESVPLDEPLTDDDAEDTPPGRSASTPLDEPIDDADDGDDTVPLDEPITDAEEDDETVPIDEPTEESDVEDTTDEPGDWEPLDESDLKD